MSTKILVVDDEPDLKSLISQKFRKQVRDHEYVFTFAESGAAALRELEADGDMDLVMTDINMPEMDGLTLLAKINERYPLIKSMIVSAYGDMANIRTALNRGAFDFITKPIDFQDLEITLSKTIQAALAHRQSARDRDRLVALQRELDVARRIQSAIVPRTFPPFPERPEFEIQAEMIPAREVGGDFYDFFLIDHERLGFVIGDVSGKGVPAALFMAVSKTLLKATALTGVSPQECLQQVNSVLCLDNPSAMFVTVFYGILNTRSGQVAYCNGGHNPPYILRAGAAGREASSAARAVGSLEASETTGGLVLGAVGQSVYRQKEIILHPGDGIFLYTDGVTEAVDASESAFTETRLQECLRRLHGAALGEVVEGVTQAVKTFAQDAPQADDLTILAVRYLG
jgi:sigma-B regulation protein RsbU (phosphoserine phosphatase)